MECASRRLIGGMRLYAGKAREEIAKKSNQTPKVTYPDKVVKRYFNGVRQLGHNRGEVLFLERTYYRKVAGYEQVNYVRHRIYSEVLSKDKPVSVKIDTSMRGLSILINSGDVSLRENALLIVATLGEPALCPRWAQEVFFNLIHEETERKIKEEHGQTDFLIESAIETHKKQEKKLADGIEKTLRIEKKANQTLISLVSKAARVGYANHPVVASVLTLGLGRPLSKSMRLKKKAARQQTKLDKIYVVKCNAIKELREIEVERAKKEAQLARSKTDGDFAAIVERAQHEFDLTCISDSFYDPGAPKGPEREDFSDAEPNYRYEMPKRLVAKQSGDGFEPMSLNLLSKYTGLYICAIYLIHEKESGRYVIGVSFDMGESLKKIYRRYASDELKKKKKGATDADLAKMPISISIAVVTNAKDMKERFAALRKQFDAAFLPY